MRTDQRGSTIWQPSRLVAVVTASLAWVLVALPVVAATGTYRNPLEPSIPGDGIAENCPDPTVIWGAEGEGLWFMYCTSDPRNDEDRNANDEFIFHLLPTYSSPDLVTWTYRGDALDERPEYAFPDAFIWAPDIVYAPEVGEYRLYYSVVDADVNGGGSAIGVATAPTPLGPWTQSDEPVVEPHPADCCGEESRRVTIDPEVLRTPGVDYMYYGSFFGGVSVRELSEDGLRTDPATQTNVAIANKFEAPEIVDKDGWYYLFLSATGCCNGPQTGYAVLVGRSKSPTGPFLDRHGIDLNANEGPDAPPPTDGRAGGTPVIYQNGNRWVGPGHNTMLRDFAGQWWTVYHAIDVNEPYFADAVGFTKRSPMLDAIDWIDGWPTLNGGRGPSDTPQPAPAAQPGQRTNHQVQVAPRDRVGRTVWADGFDSSTPTSWTWIRESNVTACASGQLCMEIQHADLFGDTNSASVLVRSAPPGDWVVETKVRVDVPVDGCCFNYAQAGLVVYEDDDNYIKLVNASIWNTRQTEYAREIGPVPADYPFYGNSVIGPPGDWTWLRIVKRTTGRHTASGVFGGRELYTAYTSPNGLVWDRGATWAHDLGKAVRVGIVAMGVVPEDDGGPPSGETYTAAFDYVRVSHVTR